MPRVDGPEDELQALLERMRAGDDEAASRLFDLLYPELPAIAGRLFRSQRGHHTLQPPAVVHEAYLKMARAPGAWNDRTHFCSVAARAMRQVLVNHARDRSAVKRGGGLAGQRVTLSDAAAGGTGNEIDVLAAHEALEELGRLDERQARVAELRFFAGLDTKEIAEALGIAPRTVELDWKMAKDWLAARLGGE